MPQSIYQIKSPFPPPWWRKYQIRSNSSLCHREARWDLTGTLCKLELPLVYREKNAGRLYLCPLSALLSGSLLFLRVWNFPPANQTLILEKKLIEQKGGFLLSVSHWLLGGRDPFRGSPRTHLCIDRSWASSCLNAIVLAALPAGVLWGQVSCVAWRGEDGVVCPLYPCRGTDLYTHMPFSLNKSTWSRERLPVVWLVTMDMAAYRGVIIWRLIPSPPCRNQPPYYNPWVSWAVRRRLSESEFQNNFNIWSLKRKITT